MKNISNHLVAAALASTLTFTAAQASTTISVTTFDEADFQTMLNGFASSTVEDFESITVGQKTSPFSTAVGTFSTLGGTGSGATVSGTADSDGTDLYVRGANTFGRENTTPGGSNFLDSNDTFGVKWVVDIGSMFDRIMFTLSDASDTGANLTILADGTSLETFFDGQSNGKTDTILISFDFVTNDGFGLDDLTVGAAVPLPPAVAMLGAGVVALGALRRRRKAA